MPALKFSVPHQLGRQEARRRLDSLFPKLQTQYSQFINQVDYEWHGDTCNFDLKVKGFTISGDLTVEEALVNMSLNLPFAAMLFKDKIQQTIESQSKVLLGPGK